MSWVSLYIDMNDSNHVSLSLSDRMLGPNEYFYRRQSHSQGSSSTNSSMSAGEKRQGGPEEFADMVAQHAQAQRRSSQHHT